MTFLINGPNGGNGLIFGNTVGADVLNGFDFNNVFISGGADDQIFTGAGSATVNLGAFVGVTDTVNVGGAFNAIVSGLQLASVLTVQGGSGSNDVSLANTSGINNVAMQGFNNVITVNSDATNLILSGAGRGRVSAGSINDGNLGFTTSVAAAGQNNTVIGGDQDFHISGGQGFDFISIGNGDNVVTESGTKDKITVGIGSNIITDLGGAATITFVGHIRSAPLFANPQTVTIGGTNNIVTEADLTSDRDITISGGTGNGRFSLGDGVDVLTTSGSNNVVTMGTTDQFPFGDSVTISGGGSNNHVTLGNGNNHVSVDGTNSIIVVGNGANLITANGSFDTITVGNGNNNVTANGNLDTITVGNGNNTIQATGNGDTIHLGTGNDTLNAAGGNNDVITSAGGKGTFTIGHANNLTLSATAVGTTVDAQGTDNVITLVNKANVAINDSPFGGGLSLEIDAAAGAVKLTGFGSDVLGLIDLHGFAGITNNAQLAAVSGSDGAGGTLIHLGTGSLDLVAATINNAQFSFA